MGKQRACGFDNLKFLLICCVVLGHLIECRPMTPMANYLYRLIYTFHMPAFLFLSGWFARFDRRKLVFQMLYPYLLFQLLYQLFDHCVLAGLPLREFTCRVSTPYWLLWYLFALVFFHLLLPLLDVQGRPRQGVILALAILACLAVSADTSVGYFFSLGRIFTFLPFFLLGFYLGKRKSPMPRPGLGVSALLTAGLALVLVYLLPRRLIQLPLRALYGVQQYEQALFTPGDKALLLLIAGLWLVFFLLVLLPRIDRPIPVITTLGRNTLPIFLLHGFVVVYAKHHGLFAGLSMVKCGLVTAGLVLILGNPLTARVFRWLFSGWWLEKLWDKLKK